MESAHCAIVLDKMPPLCLFPPVGAISQVLSFQIIFSATWQKYWNSDVLSVELLMQFFIFKTSKRDLPDSPVDKDSPSNVAGMGSIFGWRAEIPPGL